MEIGLNIETLSLCNKTLSNILVAVFLTGPVIGVAVGIIVIEEEVVKIEEKIENDMMKIEIKIGKSISGRGRNQDFESMQVKNTDIVNKELNIPSFDIFVRIF